MVNAFKNLCVRKNIYPPINDANVSTSSFYTKKKNKIKGTNLYKMRNGFFLISKTFPVKRIVN